MIKEKEIFEKLLASYREYGDKKGEVIIKKAYQFAKLAHTGQKRLSGEDFIIHPLSVALILCDWRLDSTSIASGLLHDTVEDGGAKKEDIVENFGEDISLLVDGVTKVTTLKLKGSKEKVFLENLRKMILVMAQDLRVVLVKLADRVHNMRTLSALPPEKQKENALETLEIYAPLAERLGIGEVKGILEDLSFPFVFPEEYSKVKKLSRLPYKRAQGQISKMKNILLKNFAKEKIKVKIHGREKHLYSLWRKLTRPEIDWDFDKINDMVALRIIVKRVDDCYAALGIVHSSFKPVPFIGVSDFIAQPKPNGYRSIHTKVFGLGKGVVEIQIRTERMHEEAEYGVAAHWNYAEEKSKGLSDEKLEKGTGVGTQKLSWVKQLVNWQDQITDTKEFLEAVKFDAFSHRHFVFSPRGDVFDLPRWATPVDFAYAVHTNLGNYIKGAKVDGKIVPLDYKLKSGQVVEILKTKEKKLPNHDWLNSVRTTTAKREIKKNLRERGSKE